MKYYRLVDDLDFLGRWSLGEVNFDNMQQMWSYLKGGDSVLTNKEFNLNLSKDGIPLDFTFADFDVIIINEKVVKLLNNDDINIESVKINSFKNSNQYYLLKIKNELECVDEDNSEFEKWEEGNSIRPDKAGRYKTFIKLIINSDLETDSDIFRIKNYNIEIIVSENLKNTFESSYY